MKKKIQNIIRNFHKLFLTKKLSDKLAIYFHSVEEKNIETFIYLLNYFKNQGYNFVNAREFVNSTDKKILFTSFDDNYYSWFTLLDIFEKLNIHATFYINAGPIRDLSSKTEQEKYFDLIKHKGQRKTLSTDEIKIIKNRGHEIGNHTNSHRMLTSVNYETACEDIELGKINLEKIIDAKIEDFSFPFGMKRHFNEQLRKYCEAIGLTTVANAIPCLQYSKSDLIDINRAAWNFDISFEENIENLKIDGRIFERITGRSPIG